jgi:hypothetical protein
VDGGTGLRGDPGENGDLLASLGQLHERDSLITGPIDLQSRTLGGPQCQTCRSVSVEAVPNPSFGAPVR